jgi:hypothetical protein
MLKRYVASPLGAALHQQKPGGETFRTSPGSGRTKFPPRGRSSGKEISALSDEIRKIPANIRIKLRCFDFIMF